MADLKTLTYKVTVDTGAAKNNLKTFQTTFTATGDTAQDVDVKMQKLGDTLAKEYGQKISVARDFTKSQASELKRMARESSQADKALDKLTNEFKAYTAAAGKGADEQQILNAQLRLGKNATQAQKDEVRKLVSEYQKVRNAANKTQGSMRGFRGQMSAVGFQLQDVAVQAQMGTNAFVILGQQGSQLAGAFGPTGALIGAGIAFGAMLGNVLMPGLFDTGESVDKLSEKFRELAKSTGITANKARFLIETEKRDAVIRNKKIDTLKKEIIEYARGRMTYDQYTKAVDIHNKTQGNYDKQIRKNKLSLKDWTKLQSDLNYKYLKNITSLEDLNDETKESAKNIEIYKAAVGDIGTETLDKWKDSNEEIVKSLKRKTDQLGMTTSESLKYELAQKRSLMVSQQATDEQKAEVESLYAILIARAQANEEIVRQNKLKVEQARLDRAQAKVQADMTKAWQQQQVDMTQRLSDMENIKKRLGVGDLRRLDEKYAKEREMFRGHTDVLKKLEEEYQLNRLAIQGSTTAKYIIAVENNMRNFDDIATESINNFTRGFGQAFGDAIFESESLGEAMQGIFVGVAKNMVAFFAEWAAQELILWTLKKTLGAAAGAGAAVAVNAEAQTSSLMAGLNAFSSTAAIPIVGPALAPAAMGAALSITQPIAAVIGGLSTGFAGQFDKGGTIPQDMYGIMSEYGDELANGVLVRGGQGGTKVTSREDTAKMMNGGGGVTFNITGNQQASAEQISRAIIRKLKSKGTKGLDDALYASSERGRRNQGGRYARN